MALKSIQGMVWSSHGVIHCERLETVTCDVHYRQKKAQVDNKNRSHYHGTAKKVWSYMTNRTKNCLSTLNFNILHHLP